MKECFCTAMVLRISDRLTVVAETCLIGTYKYETHDARLFSFILWYVLMEHKTVKTLSRASGVVLFLVAFMKKTRREVSIVLKKARQV